MATDWPTTTLGALLAEEGGTVKTGPFGTTLKAHEYSAVGVPLISVGEVGDGSLRVSEKTPRVPVEVTSRLLEYLLEPGDIVFGRKGTVDRSALVKDSERGWFLGSDGIRLRLPDSVDARFFAYQLQSGMTKSWLRQNATGSTMPSLSQGVIERVPVVVPPLPEQRRIAHILGTLDDKIELNRRMNETLEEMARALFKSWFVDFDPVRAKAEGRDPGLSPHLADLFSDRLVDSELGEIPEGWEVKALGEHFDAVKGVSYKGSGLGGSGVPLHNLNSVFEGGGYKHAGIKYYNGEYTARHVLGPGDVIVANTEQGHERLLIGYAALVPPTFGGFGIASHHIYVMEPRAGSVLTREFLCDLLNSRNMHDVTSRFANGTTVNMLPVDGLQLPRFASPPGDLCEVFTDLRRSARRCKELAFAESATLDGVRNLLLPALLAQREMPDEEGE